jgi:hypothetical protein
MNFVVQMFVNTVKAKKIEKQEIKGNFENVFAPSICSVPMNLLNNS